MNNTGFIDDRNVPSMFIVLKEKTSCITNIVFINVLTFEFYRYHVILVIAKGKCNHLSRPGIRP